MKFQTKALFSAAAFLAFSSLCSADQINGSLPLAGFDVTQDGANLSVSMNVFSTATLTSGPGANDFSPIPIGTDFGPTDLNLNDLTAFTISNAVFGSFTTTSSQILTQNANFLDVSLLGTFTPGLGLPGLDATESSLRISINQSGNSLSEAITLSSPPAGFVPEPGSLALLGTLLVGLGVFGRKLGIAR